MELAYRLAVDESPYIQAIRDNVITLITPVVEVDGRDRMVDVYRWHLAHPKATTPRLMYWGHYVAHDNNRDAMGLTLSLSRQVLDTYLGWHAQVLHDLHESVPFLYDNTVGDGPYNAWVDPLLTNEWQLFGWMNVAQMTKFGMPGVYTHGNFDTWSPGYLMFMAAMHNGVSRLYETFGNGGADTETRELDADETSRTWYRQDPPYRTVSWSQRNNNNYEQTGLLVSLAFTAENRELLLRNFWEKSKRSINKPEKEGPAAYVLPADDRRPGAQAELLRVLRLQHVEISRADKAFTVAVESQAKPADKEKSDAKPADKAPATRKFPAGSYVVRMDQPYSRIADALLDRQYWSPDDPQKHPYDDTGWSFPALFDTEAVRVTDRQVLAASMSRAEIPARPRGGVTGGGPVFVVAQHGDDAMFSLRYALGDAKVEAASEPFKAGGHDYPRGTWLVRGIAKDAFDRAATDAGVTVETIAAAPKIATRPVGKPRIALLHTWLNTQTEGWWRQRLDLLKIPYTYISTQDVAADANLGELRRHPLPARRSRGSAAHRQRPADVGRADALEDDAGDAEPRQDRRHRRHAPRPGLRRTRSPPPVRAAGGPAGRSRGHRAIDDRHRPGPRRASRKPQEPQGGRQRPRRPFPRPHLPPRRRPGRSPLRLQRRRHELRAEQLRHRRLGPRGNRPPHRPRRPQGHRHPPGAPRPAHAPHPHKSRALGSPPARDRRAAQQPLRDPRGPPPKDRGALRRRRRSAGLRPARRGGELARRAAVVEVPVGKGKRAALRHQPGLAGVDGWESSVGLECDSAARVF